MHYLNREEHPSHSSYHMPVVVQKREQRTCRHKRATQGEDSHPVNSGVYSLRAAELSWPQLAGPNEEIPTWRAKYRRCSITVQRQPGGSLIVNTGVIAIYKPSERRNTHRRLMLTCTSRETTDRGIGSSVVRNHGKGGIVLA